MIKLCKGFSIIELIAVMVILGVLAAGSAGMLAEGLSAYSSAQNVVNANWEGRLALARMTREIHNVRSSSDMGPISSTSLAFTDILGNSIVYTISGSNLTRAQNGGAAQNLASGLGSLTMSYFDNTGATTAIAANVRLITVTITITENNVNYTFNTNIDLRDLM